MRFLSMFSGIDAASVAWNPLGWEAAAFCEIEPFPSAVLAHHYPHVPNLGDVTKANFDEIGPIDLAVFGSPCQSFSVAGKRLGLDDPRGNLALYALSVVERLRPRWFLFENVPGLLSSGEGRDFGAFLGSVGDIGYQCAWRTLDAQHFGVPQRRRRVFVVGHLGDWRRAAAVLFERHSLQGNPAPRREAREDAAKCLRGRANCSHRADSDNFVATFDRQSSGEYGTAPVASTVSARDYKGVSDIVTFNRRGREGGSQPEMDPENLAGMRAASGGSSRSYIAFTAKDHGADASDISPTLRSGSHSGSHANGGVMPAVAFQTSQSGVREVEAHATLDSNNGSRRHNGVVQGSAVRRLTPMECERLQGFPDDYTAVSYRGKPAADGPRYKALGNSMAVPVMRWIGERIAMVDAIAIEAGTAETVKHGSVHESADPKGIARKRAA